MYRLAIGDKPLHCSSVQVRAHLEVQVEGSISPCPALPCTFCQWGGRQSLLVCWFVFFFFCFFVSFWELPTQLCAVGNVARLAPDRLLDDSLDNEHRSIPPCRRRQRVLPGAQQHGQRPTIVRDVETCRKWRKSMFSALSSSQRSACYASDAC